MSRGIILVVDDQPLILKLVEAILEGMGLDIVSTNHSGQAVQLASEHRDRIRLLITDLRMCGLGGEDLAREVMKHSPRLRVLYMSGDRPDDLRLAADLHHDFIGKPFSPAELSRRVEALLAQ